VLMAVFALPLVTHADNGLQSGRLVTVHDRGGEKVILTKADTIGGALKEAGVTIDDQDAVEPAVSEKLVAPDYQVNIYRARPVIVVDGNIRQRVITPYQTADQIARSVGITLYPEDKTSIDLISDLTQGAGLQLTITRATTFQFTLYGKTTVARTQAKTVGEMLVEKGLKISKDDRVAPDISTQVTDNLVVKLWREGKQTVTVDEAVAFQVQQIRDADRDVGYKNIQVPGADGSRNVTYEITIKDGQEVGRVEIASIATKQATTQIEVIGSKPKVGTPNENRNYARAIMGSYGFGDDQWVCLDTLWTHESGWDQYKSNYSGSGAYGIPQALPGSKMGEGWQNDPVVQINWGLNYIKARYSNPCGAYSHWRSSNWY